MTDSQLGTLLINLMPANLDTDARSMHDSYTATQLADHTKLIIIGCQAPRAVVLVAGSQRQNVGA